MPPALSACSDRKYAAPCQASRFPYQDISSESSLFRISRATNRLSTSYVPESIACFTLAIFFSSTTGIAFAFSFSLATSSFQPDNSTLSVVPAAPCAAAREVTVLDLAEEDTGRFFSNCKCLPSSIFMEHLLTIFPCHC